MSKCCIEECNYFSYQNSKKCSLHYREETGKIKIIIFEDLIKRYDESIKDVVISKKEELNIFNLIKKTKEKNMVKIIKIITIYLKIINKEYINSSLCLKLVQYFEGVNSFHYFYWLVRDYWNIDSNHDSSAICYYHPELLEPKSCKYLIDNEKRQNPILPLGYSFFLK